MTGLRLLVVSAGSFDWDALGLALAMAAALVALAVVLAGPGERTEELWSDRTDRRTFLVRAGSEPGEATVHRLMLLGELPQVGDRHPDTGLVASDVEATRTADPGVWAVTVSYRGPEGEGS